MGIFVDWTKPGKANPYTVSRRMVLLEDAGFGAAQVEFMKYMRLTPHNVKDDFGVERKSTAMYKLYREQKRIVRAVAVTRGISKKEAAAIMRAEADKAVEDWQRDYKGLPPEYDPINLMGYTMTTRIYA